MHRYLISFDDGSMDHIPDEDWPEVGEASHAVVREAQDAGIWIFGGGIERQQATIVNTEGAVTDGPSPETKAVIGGFSIIEVPRGRRRCTGLLVLPAAAVARRRFGRSCTTRPLRRRLCRGTYLRCRGCGSRPRAWCSSLRAASRCAGDYAVCS